jgi:hypothetical protein
MNSKIKWEEIDVFHRRAKVIGGWLFKSTIWQKGTTYMDVQVTYPTPISESICFIPDPEYKWEI